MRHRLLVAVLLLFAAWFVWKARPFLTVDRTAIWATPTTRPTEPTSLAPVQVKKGRRACLDKIDFGPQARYVEVTLQGRKPSPALRVVASAPGYRAVAPVAPGVPTDHDAIVKIAPAPREVEGTLCFINEGDHAVSFYGVAPGRGLSPSTTTVDGTPVPQDLSVTLLQSPAHSIGGRLGDIAAHIAAFRPVTGWEVFVLGLLAVLGVPLAVGVALSRAAEADAGRHDDEPPADQLSARR